MKNFTSIKEMSKEEILETLNIAKKLEIQNKEERIKIMQGSIMTSIFFEPSTRTRLSFTSSAYKLGCNVLGFDNPDASSIKKGESFRDTIYMVSSYSDVIVVRHFIEGVAKFASEITKTPIINAGDGANEHPSQTLLDLYTIKDELRSIENKKIAFVGDLKYGRTVHSLSRALSLFNLELYFVAPDNIQIPEYILKELDANNIKYHLLNNYESILKEVDCLYMTRIQRERFDDLDEYEKIKNIFIISKKEIENKCKDNMIIMHPLPRVDEINIDLDNTKYAKYFKQAYNGVPVRMAMLTLATDSIKSKFNNIKLDSISNEKVVCTNSKCITNFEPTQNRVIKKEYGDFCYYCNKEIK